MSPSTWLEHAHVAMEIWSLPAAHPCASHKASRRQLPVHALAPASALSGEEQEAAQPGTHGQLLDEDLARRVAALGDEPDHVRQRGRGRRRVRALVVARREDRRGDAGRDGERGRERDWLGRVGSSSCEQRPGGWSVGDVRVGSARVKRTEVRIVNRGLVAGWKVGRKGQRVSWNKARDESSVKR